MPAPLHRRDFLLRATAASALALYQPREAAAADVTRPDIASLDRARILERAAAALDASGPVDFLRFTLDLPALAAAVQIDPDQAGRHAARATTLLRQWLVTPATRLDPSPHLAAPAELNDRAALAEVIVALPFLHLPDALAEPLAGWCREHLAWLTSDRAALLARDAHDHTASTSLLLTAACARHLADDPTLADARHRFQKVTLRAQIDAAGAFPHELTGPAPLRNSLFNLDLLAGAVQLLSTRFDSLWDRELQDGPGLRAAIARHVPYIASPRTWPYPADSAHFHALPGRRPALVFAARAYNQPDYATLWRTLDPDPADPVVLASFPIRQPLLWLAQPRRAVLPAVE